MVDLAPGLEVRTPLPLVVRRELGRLAPRIGRGWTVDRVEYDRPGTVLPEVLLYLRATCAFLLDGALFVGDGATLWRYGLGHGGAVDGSWLYPSRTRVETESGSALSLRGVAAEPVASLGPAVALFEYALPGGRPAFVSFDAVRPVAPWSVLATAAERERARSELAATVGRPAERPAPPVVFEVLAGGAWRAGLSGDGPPGHGPPAKVRPVFTPPPDALLRPPGAAEPVIKAGRLGLDVLEVDVLSGYDLIARWWRLPV